MMNHRLCAISRHAFELSSPKKKRKTLLFARLLTNEESWRQLKELNEETERKAEEVRQKKEAAAQKKEAAARKKEAAAQKKMAAAQNKKATNRKRGRPRTKPNIESESG